MESIIEGTEVTCRHGAVSTGPAGGARVGAQILRIGGNAIDAAVAASLACAVLEPQAVDLGGYVAAAVVLEGKSGRLWSVDANSVAPEAAREEMYGILPMRKGSAGINELEYGCSVAGDANIYGPLSIAVPGFLGGIGAMWERWGRLKWGEVVAPARELVETSHYSLVREAILLKREAIARFPTTTEILLPGGNVPEAGDAWKRPDLARTLDRLAAHGWRDFYDGEIGRTIADFVSSQGGLLTRDDMAGFAPRITEPLSGRYRDALVHTAIAPNGGFSVLSALQELNQSEALADTDPRYWDRLAAILQRMWSTRLAGRRVGATPHGTIHVAAADAEGNLVSATLSQGGLFGSCLAVPGTGIILSHGMCRFDPHPGIDNSPRSRKRPMNNVCPMIIQTPERDIAIGGRGGRRIVSVCTQLVQRIVDYGATTHQAAMAPRIHTLTGDPLEVSSNFDLGIREVLNSLGHHIEVPKEVAGAAHGAEIRRLTGEVRAGGNTWAAGI